MTFLPNIMILLKKLKPVLLLLLFFKKIFHTLTKKDAQCEREMQRFSIEEKQALAPV